MFYLKRKSLTVIVKKRKKSHTRETSNLLTDADNSTDAMQGGPRIQKKIIIKTEKLKNVQRYAKISNIPFDQRSLIHWEAWFPPCFVRKNQQKTNLFLRANFRPHRNKMFNSETTSFQHFPPKDSESLNFLDIQLWEVGAKQASKYTT